MVGLIFIENDQFVGTCHSMNGPIREPHSDKFIQIYITEKDVKLFSSGRNSSFSISSIEEASPIAKATGVIIKNSPCIILGIVFQPEVKTGSETGNEKLKIVTSSGTIVFLSVPGLKVLFNSPFLPRNNLSRILSTTSFLNDGLGIYLTTPFELQRFLYTEVSQFTEFDQLTELRKNKKNLM